MLKPILLPLTSDINEALADPNRYIDQQMLDHVMEDIEKNGRASRYYTKFRQYMRETDVKMKELRAAEMLMSPEMARNYVRELYQKNTRNKVFSVESLSSGDGESGSFDVDFFSVYTTPGSVPSSTILEPSDAKKLKSDLAAGRKRHSGKNVEDVGMFGGSGHVDTRNPSGLAEIKDFFTKFFNHKDLSREAKIVAITRLMTGAEAGRGGKKSGAGLDLSLLVDKMPKEYDEIEKQIERLKDAGLPDNEIESTIILRGYKDPNSDIVIPQLVSNAKIDTASANVAKVLEELTGVKVQWDKGTGKWDLNALRNWLFSGNVNESLDDIDESLANRTKALFKVTDAILGGKGVVKTSELISAIVFAVSNHKALGTAFSKKYLTGSVKEASSRMLKSVKGDEQAKQKVIGLFLDLATSQDPKMTKRIKETTKKLDALAKKVK